MKQTLKIGITALVIAGLTMSGIALAQTDDATTPGGTSGGVAAEETGAYEGILGGLQGLVDDGTITQDQAEAVAEVLAKRGPRFHGPGHGRGPGLDAAAEFLGLTVDEIRAALEDGSTLADIAADNGSSAQALIDALVADCAERLDEAVAEGRIDQAEADERLAAATERITAHVNGEAPEGGFGPGGPRGPRGGGPGGPGGPGGEFGPGPGAGVDA